MKKKRFTEEQIDYALAQGSMGQTIAEVCRRLGVPFARASSACLSLATTASGRCRFLFERIKRRLLSAPWAAKVSHKGWTDESDPVRRTKPDRCELQGRVDERSIRGSNSRRMPIMRPCDTIRIKITG